MTEEKHGPTMTLEHLMRLKLASRSRIRGDAGRRTLKARTNRRNFVKPGLGVGILAPWVAQKELTEGSLVALPPGRRRLTRQWGVLHARGRRLSLTEETFIGLCRSATEAGIYHAAIGAGG